MKIRHVRDYCEARKEAYPPVGDQLDALFRHFASDPDNVPAELQGWVDACMAVKEKYPKAE
jgi:hypothetical protein